jgi:protein ImuA
MFSSAARTETTARTLAELRAQIARIEHGGGPDGDASRETRTIRFGIPDLDQRSGGLARGALHEVAGAGPDTEHGAAAALFLAGVLARLEGPVLWVRQQRDLFAPGLACAGLHPDRLVFADAGPNGGNPNGGNPNGGNPNGGNPNGGNPNGGNKDVLAAMEEGLSHAGLAAVVGEFSGRLSLVASRRLQLAAGQSGVMAALLRRSRTFNDPELAAPSAAVTRWRIAALPSAPPLPHAPSVPGLGPALWRLELTRRRGGEAGSWIVEACDATGRLTLATDVGHGSAARAGRPAARAGRTA